MIEEGFNTNKNFLATGGALLRKYRGRYYLKDQWGIPGELNPQNIDNIGNENKTGQITLKSLAKILTKINQYNFKVKYFKGDNGEGEASKPGDCSFSVKEYGAGRIFCFESKLGYSDIPNVLPLQFKSNNNRNFDIIVKDSFLPEKLKPEIITTYMFKEIF